MPSVRHRIVFGPEQSDSNSFHDESSIVSTSMKSVLKKKDEKQLPFLIRSQVIEKNFQSFFRSSKHGPEKSLLTCSPV